MNVLEDIIFHSIFFMSLGLIVYFLTIKLRFNYKAWDFDNTRKNAVYALAAVCTSFFITAIILFLASSISKSNTGAQAKITYNVSYVLSSAVVYLLYMLPVLIAKRLLKQSWGSMGVSSHNLKKSIVVGTMVGIISIIFSLIYMNVSVIKVVNHLNTNHLGGLAYCAVVGFSEEFVIRGYLQTRLIAWLGKNKGWLISSVLMVLIHLPQRIFIMGMTISGAFTSIFYLTFASLFLGYIMIKTENIFAPAIVHTLLDWVNVIIEF